MTEPPGARLRVALTALTALQERITTISSSFDSFR
jgi:F0F1-type ATP synthase beta subunit